MTPLGITAIVLGAAAIALVLASEIWTKYLWFEQLGFTDVLLTRWVTQGVLFVIGFALFAVPLYLSLRHAYTSRPVYPPITREQEALEQFRAAVDPLRRGLTIIAPLLIGGFGGLAAARRWQEVQLFLHPQQFGTEDPVFGRDISFYVFQLPIIDDAIAFTQFVFLVALVGALIGHFVYGGVAWGQESGLEVTRGARQHLGILAAGYVLLLGVGHWFHRYSLLNERHSRFDGASYTDVNAILPAQTILAISGMIVAVLFIVWVVRADWRIPAIGAGLMLLSTLVVGNAYPWAIQQFRVGPNERALEQPYIQRNIDATRAAFGLNDVREVPYAATTDAEPGALRSDADTTAQIRLMDPAVVSPTFEQREANRRYWGFDSVLSVDRYEIDGQMQDTVIGVRELRPDKFDLDNQPWVNRHIVYTHGYGTAAAHGNRRNADGEPGFLQSGVPGKGALGSYEERVYFGRHSPQYSIVGGPDGADPEEFDYQTGTGEDGDAGAQVNTTFDGDGGPNVGNPFNRLLYAIKFRDPNIVISNYVNSESQILYDRDPQQRVREVAPFLSLDSQIYPAVVDEKLVWVVDGFTSTDRYPYSRTADMNQVVTDSQTKAGDAANHRVAQANYLRNGVKATVDAFDGSVTLYAWDTDDPILAAWQEVFPQALKPASEISSELMSHLRYPADLFKAQREMLATYHVTDADEFFGQQDFWQVPPDPRLSASRNADMNQVVTDSQTKAGDAANHRVAQANYLRNGVKATVDAFDGSVTLYAWDTDDPILAAWQEVFPQALKPASEISSELMSHLRYPADLFKAQREMLATYHVTDADEFFGQQDFWQVPPDPRLSASRNADGTTQQQPPQPPMYLTMQVPGMDDPRFTLSSSFIPAQGQNVLTGFLAVDSETGNEAGNPAKNYGQLSLLVLPASNPVNGPGQVQATFNSEPNVSRALNLLKSGNSEVINGNLLTLPVGGGLLYVQPVYLQSSATGGGTQYPLLQMVLVSFGEKIGFAPTLDQALDEVFGGDSGAAAGDAAVPDTGGQSGSADTETGEADVSDEGEAKTPEDQQPAAPGAGAQGSPQERLDQALKDMDAAVKDGEKAMSEGDWAAYGEAQKRVSDALNRAVQANKELGGSAPAPSDGGEG